MVNFPSILCVHKFHNQHQTDRGPLHQLHQVGYKPGLTYSSRLDSGFLAAPEPLGVYVPEIDETIQGLCDVCFCYRVMSRLFI